MGYSEDIQRWGLSKKTFDLLENSEKEFVKQELENPYNLPYYQNRLRDYGFVDLKNVLDVGCGIGQWTCALASLNTEVQGIDINTARLLIASECAENLGYKNLRLRNCAVDSYHSGQKKLNGIFCYGVFMFTDKAASLNIFNKNLEQGGLLYLNFNSIGWWLYLLFERGIKERNSKVIKMLFRSSLKALYKKEKRIFVSNRRILKQVQNSGFAIVHWGPEGTIQNHDGNTLKYAKTYRRFSVVTEILAIKTHDTF